MAVIASLVVGSNGATSLGGSSRGLSTPPDRRRFLKRHQGASAFIIGKESARRESYESNSVPIFVFTRTLEHLTFNHPMMQQVSVDFAMREIVKRIDERIKGDIVVEAGPQLLTALVEEGSVDFLELSISPISGDGNFIDVQSLLNHFDIDTDVTVEGTRLLECRYKRDSGNS